MFASERNPRHCIDIRQGAVSGRGEKKPPALLEPSPRPRSPLLAEAFSQRDRVMLITICRLYDSYTDASRVVVMLEAAGLPPSETSVISNNSDTWYSATKTANVVPVRKDGASSKADGKVEGAALGAAIGATAATAASLVTMLAIPGVGAVVGAGWLAALLGSMAIGGVAGGLLGALTNAGINEEDASLCRGRAPRRNRGRRTGAAERIAADRADHEPVGGESAGTQRTLQEIGLAIIRSGRRALYRRPGSQRTRTACALADRSEFDVRQGRDQPLASFSVDGRDPEAAVILEQLWLGIMVVAVVLLLLPFLLVMAVVGAAMLLWFVVSAAVVGALT